jgi:hypothetical protein
MLSPGTLAFLLVYPVIGVRLLFVSLPLIFSGLLAWPGATITLIPGSWISRHNPPAAGTSKRELFHIYLSGF